MTNSVDVLKKERSELASRIKALDSAIAVLGGGKASGKSSTMPASRRRKIALAMKKRWAEKKKAGK